MSEHLMCTDREVIAAYGEAEDAYFTWLDDVTDRLRDLGADPAQVRAFYSHDGYTTIEVPLIEPAPAGWVPRADRSGMRPAPGADGDAARAWLTRWATRADPVRALVDRGLPPMAHTPGAPLGGPAGHGRVAEHVFDDVVVVSTGRHARFHGAAGPGWTPIPTTLFDAVLAEHEAPATAVA